MKVEEKELEYCKSHIFYEGDPDAVIAKEEEAVAELRKVQIPGFRKGKAPDYAIRARCKAQIKNWIAREMASQAYDDMIFETNMKPIGMPEYKNVNLKGNDFSCEMVVMKKPVFELKPYTGFELDKPEVNRDVDARVSEAICDFRMRLGNMHPFEENDVVDVNDQITMAFKATVDGNEFEGSVCEGELYQVGSNRFPGFDRNILGMKSGDEKEFDLNFIDGDLAGKTAHFKVTVHMGTKRNMCELNEEFFKKIGAENLDDLNAKLKSIIINKIKEEESAILRRQIVNRLIEDNEFVIPEFLKKAESEHIAKQHGHPLANFGPDEVTLIEEQAVKSIKLSLVLDSVRDAEPDSVLNDAEAQNGIANRVISQGGDPKKFIAEAQKNGTLLGMVSALKDEFCLQWLVSQVKIKGSEEVTIKEEENASVQEK